MSKVEDTDALGAAPHLAEVVRRSESRFRALLENLAGAITVLDAEGRVTYVSASVETLLGHPPAHYLGRFMFEEVHAEDLPRVQEAFEWICSHPDGTDVIEVRLRHADGGWRFVEVRSRNLLDDPAVAGVVVNAHDVTERRSAQQALVESEQRFRSLFDHNPNAVIAFDLEGCIERANLAAQAMIGYAEDELRGRAYTVFAVPEDHPEATRAFAEACSGRPASFRVRAHRNGGAVIDLEGVSVPVVIDGSVVGVHVVCADVSERRELERQLAQAQKMDAVGRLAGGMAHDFNNLLTGIKGFVQMLLEDVPHGDAIREDLGEIDRATDRATAVTRHLLAFSRKQVLNPRVLDLNRIVGEMERMLRRIIGEHVELGTLSAEDLGRVRVDAGQMEQVVLNLAVNARDAMPSGGRLTLETRNVEVREQLGVGGDEIPAGRYVALVVRDTGCGMDRETLSRAFEPFFTTKEAGRGTGLGLSTVYGIVRQSGGWITAESRPGRGSTFRILLPMVEADLEPIDPGRDATRSTGTETILLVEDDATVRALVRRTLVRSGYHVLEAPNGAVALYLAEQHDGPIHLVLSDVIMPQMSGRELVRPLRRLRPNARILFMSGYTGEAEVIGELGGDGLVEKPFGPDVLLGRVRELLDAGEQDRAAG